MSQDIPYIKKQLLNYEEVDSPFDIKKGDSVKYITLQEEDEYFYDGGIYERMSDNKIVLTNNNKKIYVPLVYQDNHGNEIYKTRLFIQTNDKESICDTKTANEYEKIIQTQQMIIEKMTIQIKKHEKTILQLQNY